MAARKREAQPVNEPQENPVVKATNDFNKALYMANSSAATEVFSHVQAQLLTDVDPLTAITTLKSLADVAVEYTQGNDDPHIKRFFADQQRGFTAALERLNPAVSTKTAPTQPSTRALMTGRKG